MDEMQKSEKEEKKVVDSKEELRDAITIIKDIISSDDNYHASLNKKLEKLENIFTNLSSIDTRDSVISERMISQLENIIDLLRSTILEIEKMDKSMSSKTNNWEEKLK